MNIRLDFSRRNAAYGIVLTVLLQGCSKATGVPAVESPNASVKPATSGSSPASAGLPASGTLKVSSPDFTENQPIPGAFSSYGANQTPHVSWTKGPATTKSYLFLLEDPDAPGSKPFVHWAMANIPASATEEPGQGTVLANSNCEQAYYGPHPPSGTHRYFFEVFALDIPTIGAKDRDGALDAIRGHVVAKGQLVGLFTKP